MILLFDDLRQQWRNLQGLIRFSNHRLRGSAALL